jgi:hypothetical protein
MQLSEADKQNLENALKYNLYIILTTQCNKK